MYDGHTGFCGNGMCHVHGVCCTKMQYVRHAGSTEQMYGHGNGPLLTSLLPTALLLATKAVHAAVCKYSCAQLRSPVLGIKNGDKESQGSPIDESGFVWKSPDYGKPLSSRVEMRKDCQAQTQ
jgi:hypothetical protein